MRIRFVPGKRSIVGAAIALCVVMVVGAPLAVVSMSHRHKVNATPVAQQKIAASASSSSAGATPSSGALPHSSTNTKAATPMTHVSTPPAAGSASSTTAPTAACKLFTLGQAHSIIGSAAALDAQDSVTASQTDDMQVSSCAYTGSGSSVQLTAHMAHSAIGRSSNDVQFGSGRPTGVTLVQGYGQSAYWDASAHSLEILVNNNWFSISRSFSGPGRAGTLDEAKAAADVMVKGL